MLELFTSTKNEIGMQMRPFKDLVHVASGVRHLLGKPCHAAALPAQFLFDKVAKMNVGHASASYCRRQRLPMPATLLIRSSKSQKEKRGSKNSCLSRSPGLRIAHHPRISNACDPRWFIYTTFHCTKVHW